MCSFERCFDGGGSSSHNELLLGKLVFEIKLCHTQSSTRCLLTVTSTPSPNLGILKRKKGN